MSFQKYAQSHGFMLDLRSNKKVLLGIVLVAVAVIAVTVVSLMSASGQSFATSHADNHQSALNGTVSNESAASNSASDRVALNGSASNCSAFNGSGSNAESAVNSSDSTVTVHVTGCVVNPGVYELPKGSRVADGIKAAGGLTQEAAEGGVNQARLLSDSEQIMVPSLQNMQSLQGNVGAGEASGGGSQETGIVGALGSQGVVGGKININVATSQQLQTVSGIGESTARKIIEYREANGPFRSVDDLTNVSGIGEKRLASMRESLCV